jgi:type IV pilus assembly protein PilO
MPKAQLEKVWLAGGAVSALVVLLVGYFFFIGPQRGETGTVNTQVEAVQLQNTSLQQRIDTLTRQNKDLAKYQAALAEAELALPSTSGLPDFLRTLQSIGNATLASVSSLTVGPPTDVTTVAAAAAATPGKPLTAPTGPRIYALSITAQVSGTVDQLGAFLDQLQAVQPRAVLISQIGETPSEAGGSTGLSLTMQAFVAPTSAAESAQLASASQM